MAKAQPIHRSDWLLLALRASNGGLTPIQLQKTLFLLRMRRPDAVGSGFYSFVPYHYGPFSGDIYSDADQLAAQGQVSINTTMGPSLRRYRLTPLGQKLADQAATRAPQDGIEYLTKLVRYVQSLPFNALVRAVYQAYPEMRANSVFQD